MRTRALRTFLVLAVLAFPLAGASSCNRKSTSSGTVPTTPTAIPEPQYTPRRIPPTTTLPPGAPTRKPVLPG